MNASTLKDRNNLRCKNQTSCSLRSELLFWKNKYYELKTELSGMNSGSTNAVWVKDHGVTKKIYLSEIILMEAASNYTFIYTADGHKILSSHTLKSWISVIGNSEDFIRIHRSFLINKRHIISYNASGREIYLKGNHMVPVARRHQFTAKLHSLQNAQITCLNNSLNLK